MDYSNLRAISNSYQDAHLISLKSWKRANEVHPRDHGGPYMVSQQGFDAGALHLHPDEFVLGRSGTWVTLGVFWKLPEEIRISEYVFGTAAEVIELVDSLPPEVKVEHGTATPDRPSEPADDLHFTYIQAKPAATPIVPAG